MTATVDQLQVPYDDALSGGLALTLPAGINQSSAALQSPLNCDAQAKRRPCHANAAAEIAALVTLTTALGESPHTVCQILADNVLSLLKAGSAGVSVLSMQSDGGTLVSWPAIAGRWQAHSGSSKMLLASAKPAATPEPTAEHYLVVPFGVAGETNGATGTVWAVAHDAASGFDAEDLRQLQNLALFAAPALQAVAARGSAPTPHPAMPAPELHGARESQHATFNSLIENAPFGVYVVDAQFCLRQASAAAHKAFASVQPLIGRHFGDIVRAVWPEPFASEVLAHFRRTLDSGKAHAQPTVSELRKDTPHAESYDWKIERIVLPDGAFGVVCYFYDLTERQQAAEALRLRTAQFETLVNEAPLGIYLVDAQLRIRQVNPLALPEFGDIQDLIGSDLAAVMQTMWGPARADEIVQQFRHTLNTGEPFEAAELIALRADCGTTACYEWQIHRIPLPDSSHGVVCYFRDISSRVKAQAEIRDSELRFRAFVTASADVVYRMSPDWREMRHLNGRNFIAENEPTAQWMQDYIHQRDQPRVLAAIDAAIAAKSLFELEHRVLRVDGELGWTQSRAVPLLDADGAIMEWIGTATDVTDRKRIESDLIAALAAAEDANQAKSNFLSRMSHELRSPLNAVLGFAQLLQSRTPPPTARQEKDVGEILKAGWYLLGLIDEILDLSLIESGRVSCVMEPVRLAEVLDDCQALVEGQAAARGIRLSLPRLDDGCIVTVDRTRIKQVFINILSNAIKYNREGGTVQVHCEAAGQGRIRIRIEDSGIGLSPEQLGHIFQPFERLGQEAGAIEGTGIGLALSKHLVELMGGRIGVHSVVSQGSEFWVELDAPGAQTSAPARSPATAPALLRVAVSPGPAAAGRRPCTVLYVEDNRANQLLMQRLLARRPEVRLLLAGDGQYGVQLAHAMQPDVVLMDINLPGLSGLEAMERLAADAATAHIPVIAVSALAMRHDVDKGLRAGFFRYLSKPIKIDALTEALDAALALTLADSPEVPAGAVAAQPAREATSAKIAKIATKARRP